MEKEGDGRLATFLSEFMLWGSEILLCSLYITQCNFPCLNYFVKGRGRKRI